VKLLVRSIGGERSLLAIQFVSTLRRRFGRSQAVYRPAATTINNELQFPKTACADALG
jgi:hypothetical protein